MKNKATGNPTPVIRPLRTDEIPLLEDFLYEAIFQRDPANPIPRSELEKPELRAYIEGYGGPDDHCLVAEQQGQVVGAVWTRILAGPTKGFGNIDDQTPEFALSVYGPFRGMGIGAKLLSEMLALLRQRGYPQASLAVQKDNPAVRLYSRAGFETIAETSDEYIMRHRLSPAKRRRDSKG